MSKGLKATINDAAHALCDLNTFASIVTILEGGHIYMPGSHKASAQIIQICRREQQKRLMEYDRAVERAAR